VFALALFFLLDFDDFFFFEDPPEAFLQSVFSAHFETHPNKIKQSSSCWLLFPAN